MAIGKVKDYFPINTYSLVKKEKRLRLWRLVVRYAKYLNIENQEKTATPCLPHFQTGGGEGR